MEINHTTKASLPTVPAIPPMEKSTSGGTPAATQKAPFQSSARTSSPEPLLAGTLIDPAISPARDSDGMDLSSVSPIVGPQIDAAQLIRGCFRLPQAKVFGDR